MAKKRKLVHHIVGGKKWSCYKLKNRTGKALQNLFKEKRKYVKSGKYKGRDYSRKRKNGEKQLVLH